MAYFPCARAKIKQPSFQVADFAVDLLILGAGVGGHELKPVTTTRWKKNKETVEYHRCEPSVR